ncbi:hypothetical protein MHYP_G00288700 [Metynnis hypsauchen]
MSQQGGRALRKDRSLCLLASASGGQKALRESLSDGACLEAEQEERLKFNLEGFTGAGQMVWKRHVEFDRKNKWVKAGVISSINAGKSITLNFEKGISGRYVNVIIPGDNKVLTLCEVEVYGYPTPDGKFVTLNFEKGISGHYVNVVIPRDNKVLTLCEVEVYGYPTPDGEKKNAIPERLSGAEIRTGDSLDNNGNNNPRAGVISSIPAGKSITLNFEKGISGRYINVVIPGDNKVLTLCEVEVYGYPAPDGEKKNAIPERLSGAEIRTGDSLDNNGNNNPRAGVISSTPAGKSITLNLEKGISGHYVNVVIPRDNQVLTLCEVEAYSYPTPDGENVALKGRVTQSSLHFNFVSSAVDGNRDSVLSGGEIRTGDSVDNNGNNNPRCAVISSIDKSNPTMSFECNGMGGRAGVISSIPAGKSITLNFEKGISGRYVNVVIPRDNKVLTLCEVEVYGYPTPDGENVALKGRATQSSLHCFNFVSNAVDGNRDSVYDHGSCSHTNNDFSPWWRLDLLKHHKEFSVTITNSQNAIPERLSGTDI